jgi:curved DNA-binding protein CbpA
MVSNPYRILGVAETADDAAIKQAYLEQVRKYPPEQQPETFQAIRSAFEMIQSRRDRLRYRLFEQTVPAIDELIEDALHAPSPGRPAEQLFKRLLHEQASGSKG